MHPRLVGRALAQRPAVQSPFTPISKTDQMRRTGHAQTRRLPHEHAEPNCFEWVERCALNKYADNKHAKKNRYFSQQHFHNTTGIWRLRWEITNRSHAQVKLFHLVTPRRIHKIRELFSSEMIHHCNLRIQRPRHNRKECCNLCCRHPFRHRLDCTEVFFFSLSPVWQPIMGRNFRSSSAEGL